RIEQSTANTFCSAAFHFQITSRLELLLAAPFKPLPAVLCRFSLLFKLNLVLSELLERAFD
ncbi:MAG: hypothetical protein LLG00_06815, partial [Planctomycetaceae bacterium]|nr:hypothetical protein [Planctomycetaceae bacterium]